MKKSTKLITTAVAMVLVVAAMVVGIYAATSASSSITANVSWTATEGLEFTLWGWTYYTAEHYDEESKSFPELSNHGIDEIKVDTATTNEVASGFLRNFNATFIDVTDDGVNNPKEIYYFYALLSPNIEKINVTLTKCPTSTNDVKVEFGETCAASQTGGYYWGPECSMWREPQFSETAPTRAFADSFGGPVLAIRLTLKNPNVSLTNFDASISFSFTKANN